MSDNSQLELIRESANRPPYKQDVYVNAGQLLAEIEREYVQERTCRWKHIEGTWFISECGERYERVIPDNYCPNCGAKVVDE